MSGALQEKLLAEVGASERLYAVLDGARDPRIHPLAAGASVSRCLFRPPLTPKLEAAAPWLVELGAADEPLTGELLAAGWGRSWGIFVVCPLEPDALARHLRGFLRVLDPQRRRLFFRYYDPRVLRVFLPTLDAEETRRFFGPVRRFLLESADGLSLEVHEPAAGQVAQRRVLLQEAA